MAESRRFTPEEQREIAAEYEAGSSCWLIAKRRGASERTVYRVLLRQDVPIRPRRGSPQIQRRRFSDKEEAQIAGAYAVGVDPIELAAAWGCGIVLLRDVVCRSGGTWKRRVTTVKERNPRWSGGRMLDRDHYVLVLVDDDDPMACMRRYRGYVLEHRLVMARHLGRPLVESETVHHVNGDRTDNRIENLQLRSGKHGPYQAIGCLDCGSHRIGPVPIADEECA